MQILSYLNLKHSRKIILNYISEGIVEAFNLIFSFDDETYSAVFTTIKTSSISILITLIIGLPIGFIIGYYDFYGKKTLKLISDTLLSVPTVIIGLIVYALISYKGPLGQYEMLFTIKGIVLGQSLLGLPIVISLSSTSIEQLDKKLHLTLKSFCLSYMQTIKTVLFEARHSLFLAIVTAYGRIISEVGVVMMIGGNIKWHTRTITSAISLETNKGEFSVGIALGVILMFISFIVNYSLAKLKKRG